MKQRLRTYIRAYKYWFFPSTEPENQIQLNWSRKYNNFNYWDGVGYFAVNH